MQHVLAALALLYTSTRCSLLLTSLGVLLVWCCAFPFVPFIAVTVHKPPVAVSTPAPFTRHTLARVDFEAAWAPVLAYGVLIIAIVTGVAEITVVVVVEECRHGVERPNVPVVQHHCYHMLAGLPPLVEDVAEVVLGRKH